MSHPRDQHPFIRHQLDSRFSFQSDNGVDNNGDVSGVELDAVHRAVAREPWYHQTLSIVVVGASGDLAKKKTYPSLLNLFEDNLLPEYTVIWGYARSVKTHQQLRDHLFPHLIQTGASEIVVKDFLAKCFYHSGKSYGDEAAYAEMIASIQQFESQSPSPTCNRLFYLAIPPNVFGDSAVAIKQVGMAIGNGSWTRVIIEKPFGRDLETCNELLETLAAELTEDQMYRIDHYLGKEVVQNLLMFRFGNSCWEHMWNRNVIESVTLSFKEPFGTEGRGGYFDNFGIIRDILQNHLLQVLSVVAMEPPLGDDGDSIRNAKLAVLNKMDPISLDDVMLGQYDGYSDDPTIENKDTNCPTYAAIRCWIHTPRWEGVPFLMQAGKALDEKLCEVRVRFKPPTTLKSIGANNATKLCSNELVFRLQPNPSLELHNNIKTPGLPSNPMASIMKMNYEEMPNLSNPDAYTRLLLDVLRGKQGSFVRDDELRRSWELFSPLLHSIERDNIRPKPYVYGSKGPADRHRWFDEMGKSQDPLATASATHPIRASL
ncbi:unnamed protein product [Cylindrotheca closterium]|uniref:Glucose-6-phosphate 1-dehydrogenase n=1 Tax=Cylindrotheca closterium TaxID=2856 RepID=A0AAD2CD96_9STRA|nr:unnamed protein product [Cylindrotheca closterium]